MKSVAAIFAALVLGITSAAAQSQPAADPAFLQRALAAMQLQRNQAMDAAAVQQARAEGIQDELTKAQAKIKELQLAPTPDAPK